MVLRQRRVDGPALQGSARADELTLRNVNMEVELGFTKELGFKEAQRCLNCDIETVFEEKPLHRMRRLRRHLPGGLHHLHAERSGRRAAHASDGAGATTATQDLYVSDDLKTGRVMVKDEDVCLHCGLCAERCPTGAWDMKKFYLETAQACAYDASKISIAPPTISSSNSPTSTVRARRPPTSCSPARCCAWACRCATRNIFPSNIQGLPTWYEVRVSGQGWLGRRGGVDLIVLMNPQTWDKDVARSRERRLHALRLDQAADRPEAAQRRHRARRAVHAALQHRWKARSRASASCSRTSSMSARSPR